MTWRFFDAAGSILGIGPAGSQGVPGDQGEQGDPGPPGITWLGAWDSGTPYEIADAVSHDGSSYIATAAGTNHEPPNASYWDVLAEAAGSSLALDDLTDVNAPSPSDGDALVWDSGASEWVNGAGTPADILDIPTAETDTSLRLAPDGAGGVEWAAGGGGGGLVLLEQHTAATTATLDFTTAITSTYDDYMIEFIDLLPATNNVYLYAIVSSDGGANWDTTSGHYLCDNLYLYGNTANADGGAATTQWDFGNQVGSATLPLSGSAKLYHPLGTSAYRSLLADIVNWHNALATPIRRMVRGTYSTTTAINAIRFKFSSGDIASGTIRMYGIAK